MKKLFNYTRNIWQGEDGKPSLRALGAICLIYNFIENINWAIHKWEAGRSLEGLSLILGIEAGLITALLGLTAWTNMTAKKIDADLVSSPSDPSTKITNVETLNVTKEPTEAK